MKVSSAFNGFTTIVVLGVLLVLFLAESNADKGSLRRVDGRFDNVQKLKKSKCLQYGHSCWGGHGKRNIGDVQRPTSISDDWSLFRLVNPNYKRSSMPELAFILNRPPLEVAREIAMLRHGLVAGNIEDRDDKHNAFNSENVEEQQNGRDALYMTDPATDPENNLMQILNDNDGV